MPRTRRAPSASTTPVTPPSPRQPAQPVDPSHRRPEPRIPRAAILLAAATLAVAAAVRALGAGSDLWLDEIWGLQTATGMKSALSALTLHHEINHHLNTIWLYAVGTGASPVLYRLPALVSGVLSVAVSGLIGSRRGVATGIIAMILTATSYELVVYSSEARGYSMLVLFSLTAYYCLDRYHEEPRLPFAAGYIASAVLGMLSHATFGAVLAAGAAWSAWRVYRSPREGGFGLARFALVQGVPLAAFAALYLGDLRFVVAGGGTSTASLIDAFGGGLAWALGTPAAAPAMLIWCIAGVAALDAGLRHLRRTGSDAWLFFAGAIVVFPIVLVVARASDLVYTRHFLAGGAFLLMLVAMILGRWWEERRILLCVAALTVYVATNGWHVAELAAYGRGRYQEAIRFMAERTEGPVVTIAGDHDFRVGVELSYYMPGALGSKQGQYLKQGTWPPEGPEWIVVQRESFEPSSPPRNEFTDPGGHRYELERTVRTAPLTGLHWLLYHRRDRP